VIIFIFITAFENMDYKTRSVEYHRKFGGKLEITPKVKVTNREELSLAYSPGVAGPCLEIAKDKSKVTELTWRKNLVAVISDGTAVLGLGDIGAEAALPVMEGKCLLLKEFGGVDAVPIVLNTKDTEEIINTIVRIAPSFSGINLEDISAPRCFEIETRLQELLDIPVFHDDQHGTAIVVLAGLINTGKVLKEEIKTKRVVINGAGAAAVASLKLLIEFGFDDITICDSKGVIHRGRTDLNPIKEELLKVTNKRNIDGDLSQAIRDADIFIGLSAANVLTKEMVRTMGPNPVIFAMANPDPEIKPEEALEAGARIVSTGRSDYPNQVNNVLGFPGIFRGLLDKKVKKVTVEMKLRAANAIANLVESPNEENIIPDPFDARVAKVVAEAI
jgi:malate dehydrogenase (oxaloacetate-decarboxylating)